VDATAFNYQYGQVPGMPESYQADRKLIQLAEESIESINKGNCKQGLIGTGDSCIQKSEAVQIIKKMISDVIAVEMDAVAMAQVCYQYNTPFVIIRALSDIAGKESAQSFDEFIDQAGRHAAELIIEVINKL